MPYQNSFTTIKEKLFQENSSSALQQSINWIKFTSEIDGIIQEGEAIFKKNPTVDLTEVSRLINSGISKRQGDKRKYSFLEKKNAALKGKWIH